MPQHILCCFLLLFFFGGGGGGAEALRPSQQFLVMSTLSWVEAVLTNEDEASCSRTHQAPGEIRTRDLAIKSDTLPTELTVLLRPGVIAICYHNQL